MVDCLVNGAETGCPAPAAYTERAGGGRGAQKNASGYIKVVQTLQKFLLHPLLIKQSFCILRARVVCVCVCVCVCYSKYLT